jgi:hypothetical protein
MLITHINQVFHSMFVESVKNSAFLYYFRVFSMLKTCVDNVFFVEKYLGFQRFQVFFHIYTVFSFKLFRKNLISTYFFHYVAAETSKNTVKYIFSTFYTAKVT